MLTSLNLSAVFDTEDHHVLLTCLGDWQKWVSHPELDRSTPLSQISRLFWWVVSFQPWKLLIVWCYKDWFYLLLHLTQSFMRSLETDFFSGNRSNQIPYFIPANTDGLVEGKKKKGLIVKKMCGMNERCVQYEKDKRHWGPAVRFEVCLTWGCARKEHFIRNTGTTLNARLRRWPKASHSGPLASSVSIRAQTVPPSIHTHTLPPSLFSCFLVVRWFFFLSTSSSSICNAKNCS